MLSALKKLFSQPPSAPTAAPDAQPLTRDTSGRQEFLALPGASILKLRPIVETGCVSRIEVETGFAQDHWQRDCLPVIEAVAELVQLLPASEAHHHAAPAGLIVHMLEATEAAMRYRKGFLLPAGAPPEQQIRLQHRWTYAVFCCSMLHDIAKPLSDLDVRYEPLSRSGVVPGEWLKWEPLSGSLVACGAGYYDVSFVTGRRYEAHQTLALSLFQQLIPQSTRQWLLQDPDVSRSIQNYLSGADKTSLLANIITTGDQYSVKQNLRYGSRSRFKNARAVPLIERLNEALKRMVIDGTIRLNASGCPAWVYNGELWLVAKRGADLVREYLQNHESGAGIPNESMNDRLFDEWLDYGFVVTLPAKPGQPLRSVWRAVVEGEEGSYQHELTMLRFPLHKLFGKDPHPPTMRGRIIPLVDGASSPVAKELEQKNDLPDASVESTSQTPAKAAKTPLPPVELTQGSKPIAHSSVPSEPLDERSLEPSPNTSSAESIRIPDFVVDGGTEYFDESISASAAVASATATKVKQKTPKPVAAKGTPAKPGVPVAAIPELPVELQKTTTVAHGDLAEAFMRWLQGELGSGALRYNTSGAMVHFVDWANDERIERVMLLVTPLIYKSFAEVNQELCGADGFVAVQKAIKASGWAKKLKNESFARFQVVRANGVRGNSICATVIESPELYVNPVPPNNPALVRINSVPSKV